VESKIRQRGVDVSLVFAGICATHDKHPHDDGLPWILREACAGQYGRSPPVRALLLLL
jgi:hypothetical protein